MRILFTFSEMEAFSLAQSRYSQIYDLVRSYCSIERGRHFSTESLERVLREDGCPFTQWAVMLNEDGVVIDDVERVSDLSKTQREENVAWRYWSIRSEHYPCEIYFHAIAVEHAKNRVQRMLNAVKAGDARVSDLAKAKKALIELLLEIEW